jgi:hypothetical protein
MRFIIETEARSKFFVGYRSDRFLLVSQGTNPLGSVVSSPKTLVVSVTSPFRLDLRQRQEEVGGADGFRSTY